MGLIDARRHDLQKKRIGAVYVYVRAETGDDLLLNLAYDSRIAGNQELVRRFFDMRKKVVNLDNWHMVDARFQFRIFIRADAGDQGIRRIGDKIQPLILIFQDHVINRLGAVHRERLVVYDFFGLAVGNAPSVKGENVTAVIPKAKLLGKRGHAIGRASARQNYFLSLFLYFDQCL